MTVGGNGSSLTERGVDLPRGLMSPAANGMAGLMAAAAMAVIEECLGLRTCAYPLI